MYNALTDPNTTNGNRKRTHICTHIIYCMQKHTHTFTNVMIAQKI